MVCGSRAVPRMGEKFACAPLFGGFGVRQNGKFAFMQTLRTPDERLADLPEFPYAPQYCEIFKGDDGQLRVAWVEDGPADADPVLMLHGEPSWSFLYRRRLFNSYAVNKRP